MGVNRALSRASRYVRNRSVRRKLVPQRINICIETVNVDPWSAISTYPSVPRRSRTVVLLYVCIVRSTNDTPNCFCYPFAHVDRVHFATFILISLLLLLSTYVLNIPLTRNILCIMYMFAYMILTILFKILLTL